MSTKLYAFTLILLLSGMLCSVFNTISTGNVSSKSKSGGLVSLDLNRDIPENNDQEEEDEISMEFYRFTCESLISVASLLSYVPFTLKPYQEEALQLFTPPPKI